MHHHAGLCSDFAVLGTEFRPLCMLGKHCTEPYPQSKKDYSKYINLGLKRCFRGKSSSIGPEFRSYHPYWVAHNACNFSPGRSDTLLRHHRDTHSLFFLITHFLPTLMSWRGGELCELKTSLLLKKNLTTIRLLFNHKMNNYDCWKQIFLYYWREYTTFPIIKFGSVYLN